MAYRFEVYLRAPAIKFSQKSKWKMAWFHVMNVLIARPIFSFYISLACSLSLFLFSLMPFNYFSFLLPRAHWHIPRVATGADERPSFLSLSHFFFRFHPSMGKSLLLLKACQMHYVLSFYLIWKSSVWTETLNAKKSFLFICII